jgi:microcystin-dependent protein
MGQGEGLSNRILKTTGGEENHQLDTTELPPHSHTIGKYKRYDERSVGAINAFNDGGSGYQEDSSSGSTGGNLSHNNMQPFYVVNYIIKV